jgi:hypothetical protein
MTVRSGKCARGLKPFGIAQECGNHDTRTPEKKKNNRNAETIYTVDRRKVVDHPIQWRSKP